MVSYGELIYHFTDIYLKSAMECSICKENYTMTDDTEFLDHFMKIFVSLLVAVERDETLSADDIKETLLNRKKEEITKFQSFLKHKIAEQALEKVEKDLKFSTVLPNDNIYMDNISVFFQSIFDEGSDLVKESPVKLLRYVRTKEENM